MQHTTIHAITVRFIILLAISTLAMGAVWLYRNTSNEIDQNSQPTQQADSARQHATEKKPDSSEELSTYKNIYLSMNYPKNWTITTAASTANGNSMPCLLTTASASTPSETQCALIKPEGFDVIYITQPTNKWNISDPAYITNVTKQSIITLQNGKTAYRFDSQLSGDIKVTSIRLAYPDNQWISIDHTYAVTSKEIDDAYLNIVESIELLDSNPEPTTGG